MNVIWWDDHTNHTSPKYIFSAWKSIFISVHNAQHRFSITSLKFLYTYARTHTPNEMKYITSWFFSSTSQLHTNENIKNIFSNWEIQLNCRRSEFSFEFLSTRFATKLNMNDKIFFIYIAKQQHTQRQQQQQQQTAVALFLVFSDVRNVSKWKKFMNLFL